MGPFLPNDVEITAMQPKKNETFSSFDARKVEMSKSSATA